ncbi:hypothetical protein D2E49_06345 [Mycobacteroides abscessus]|nr:hypothetical protein DDJ87_08315 [Mycobacteroides abscessus]PVB03775.1 hypothetical protein DDJ62_07695 [Mycobacteroides abscessus]RIS18915.1 hypothetical protein D2E49_06345 [Mycobacteroides abscessus]RIS31053.1 hypothetical protein D2E47_06990 [Mycobacteroides abscessus]
MGFPPFPRRHFTGRSRRASALRAVFLIALLPRNNFRTRLLIAGMMLDRVMVALVAPPPGSDQLGYRLGPGSETPQVFLRDETVEQLAV